MHLIAINERMEDNKRFADNAHLETIQITIDFYKKVGFVPPWIGYFAEENGHVVGAAGFKGPPVNGTVEIAYGVLEEYRNQGIGTAICRQLVELSLKTDPSIKITARTFLKENFSTKVLQRNNFTLTGPVQDPEDGEVWEWQLL